MGATDVAGARRQVDLCLDAGVNLIDTADVYSRGLAEEITGEVIKGRRDALLLSTKVRMTMGPGSNDAGLSRQHIIAGCEASLRRLGTDHIDLFSAPDLVYPHWHQLATARDRLGAADLALLGQHLRNE